MTPQTTLDPRFSSAEAEPTPWAEAVEHLEKAEIFWLSTTRPDGRPHVTPLLAVWADDALFFCTGADERKAKNIAGDPRCALTTGRNSLRAEGIDIVIEGQAALVSDAAALQRVADAYEAKYGSDWHFDVGDGVFGMGEHAAAVFRIEPTKVMAFAKEPHAQTTYRFADR